MAPFGEGNEHGMAVAIQAKSEINRRNPDIRILGMDQAQRRLQGLRLLDMHSRDACRVLGVDLLARGTITELTPLVPGGVIGQRRGRLTCEVDVFDNRQGKAWHKQLVYFYPKAEHSSNLFPKEDEIYRELTKQAGLGIAGLFLAPEEKKERLEDDQW